MPSSPPDLTPSALLSAGYPSPRSRSALQPQPHAQCGCTSPGVSFPFSARRSLASVYPGGLHDRPEPSVPRVSHPLDGFSARPHAGLTNADPSRDSTGLPAALLGFPVLRPLGIQTFRSDQGDPKNSLLSTAFSSPATSPCWRALPSCASLPHFMTRPSEGTIMLPATGASRYRSQESWLSHSSEPCAPTVLRFPADFTLTGSNRLLAPLGCPATFQQASPPVIPQLRGTFATLPFTAL